jgi:hypothetical protein
MSLARATSMKALDPDGRLEKRKNCSRFSYSITSSAAGQQSWRDLDAARRSVLPACYASWGCLPAS